MCWFKSTICGLHNIEHLFRPSVGDRSRENLDVLSSRVICSDFLRSLSKLGVCRSVNTTCLDTEYVDPCVPRQLSRRLPFLLILRIKCKFISSQVAPPLGLAGLISILNAIGPFIMGSYTRILIFGATGKSIPLLAPGANESRVVLTEVQHTWGQK